MMEKLEKLEKVLDLAAEALSLYICKTQQEFEEALPLAEQPAAKPRAARKTKAAVPEAAPETFPPAPETALMEDQLEAARRCKEVVGLLIRRHLNAKPSGVDRAKAIIEQQLGAPRKSYLINGVNTPMWKLEDFTYADNVKLIPVFEKALEVAA